MKSKFLLTGLFSLMMVILVAWYLSNHWQAIATIEITSPEYLILLVALLVVRIMLRGHFHWQVMRSLDVNIPLQEVLCLNFAGTMMNQLLPMPIGAGYRATYLKSNYDFSYSLFASTLAALFAFGLLLSAALGLAAMIWIFIETGKFHWGPATILAIALIACLAMFMVPFASSSGQTHNHTVDDNWFAARARKTLTGWQNIVTSRKLILGATAVVTLSTLVGAVGIVVAFHTIGVPIGLAGAILLLSSQHVGSLIKLTPGAVGYQELVGIYFATLLSPTTAEAAVVFVIARVISTLVAVVLGIPSMWILANQRNRKGAKENLHE